MIARRHRCPSTALIWLSTTAIALFDHILFLHVLSSNNLIFILAPTTTEKRVLHYEKK